MGRIQGWCVGVIVGWASWSAAGEVGHLGDATKLAIEGASEFSPAQLQWALALDFDYQAAARPSADLDDLLRTIERRLTAGYHEAGHAEAIITAEHDEAAGRITVRVTEGPAVVAGDVRIEGDRRIDREQIVRWLDDVPDRESLLKRVNVVKSFQAGASYRTDRDAAANTEEAEQKKQKPLFQPGQAASFDEPTLEKIRTRIKTALAEQGLLFADFDVAFQQREEERKVDLILRVRDAGPVATIDDIQLTGLEKNDRHSVLDLLELKTGASLSCELLDALETKLRHSCRFWSYDVRVNAYRGENRVELLIDLVEYPHVPPIGQPLPAELEAVRKVGVWLDTLDERGEGLELEIAGQWLAGNRLALAISSREGIVLDVRTAGDDEWQLNHAAALLRDFIGIYSRPRGRKFEVELEKELVPQATISITPSDSYEGDKSSNFKYGFGLSSIGSAYFESTAHPVTLIRFIQKDGHAVAIDGQQLSITAGGLTLQADAATGALREINGDGLQIRIVPGSVRKMANRLKEEAAETENDYRSENKLLSLAAFLLHEYAKYAEDHDDANRALAAESFAEWLTAEGGRLAGDVETEILGTVASNRNNKRRFRINQPSLRWNEDDSEYQRLFVMFGPAMADILYPRGSAAWTLQREYCFRKANRLDNLYYDEIRRLLASGEMGPLACWLYCFTAANDEQFLVKAVLQYSLTRMDEEHLRRELETLLADDTGAGKLVDLAGQFIRALSLEQRREIFLRVPEKWQQYALAVLCGAVKKWPGLPPREAVVEVSVELWCDGLKAEFQRRFSDLATSAKEQDAEFSELRRYFNAVNEAEFQCGERSGKH